MSDPVFSFDHIPGCDLYLARGWETKKMIAFLDSLPLSERALIPFDFSDFSDF
jgi:hypothetical protein